MAQNGTGMTQRSGNTRHRAFLITLNNPSRQLLDYSNMAQNAQQYSMQFEKGEKKGTKHLQACIVYKNPRYWDAIKSTFDPEKPHIEVCRNKKQALEYCMKLDTRLEGPLTKGIKRKYAETIPNKYQWQIDIENEMEEQPNKRTINWIVGEPNAGKTTFIKYLLTNKTGICYVEGVSRDVFTAIADRQEEGLDSNIILMNLPYTTGDICMSTLEKLKDGLGFCPKYHSRYVVFETPHVYIFANREPSYIERSSISEDKLKVRFIHPTERGLRPTRVAGCPGAPIDVIHMDLD